MKHINTWFVISVIAGACTVGLAVSPQDTSVFTNSLQPTRLGFTNQPIRLGTTNQLLRIRNTNQTLHTNNNATLPPMYQDTISNLHDLSGTEAVNHSNDNLTPINPPNTNPPPPHVPPQ